MSYYYLEVVRGSEVGRRYCLADGATSVGRSSQNTLALHSAEKSVSGHHAIIYKSGDRISLQDLESTNGTFINSQKVTTPRVLQPGDLLTAIRISSTWAGAQFYFEKIRDRNVWDFPLMNVASAMVTSGDNIDRIRIAVNGAAARPLRLKAVEDAVRGKPRNAATGEMAGKLAVQGAIPLQFNAYKIPLMRNLVKRSIGGVEEATWTS